MKPEKYFFYALVYGGYDLVPHIENEEDLDMTAEICIGGETFRIEKECETNIQPDKNYDQEFVPKKTRYPIWEW